jgi:hypothetical protein
MNSLEWICLAVAEVNKGVGGNVRQFITQKDLAAIKSVYEVAQERGAEWFANPLELEAYARQQTRKYLNGLVEERKC